MENHPVATALATIIVSRDPQRLGAALTETHAPARRGGCRRRRGGGSIGG